MSAHRLLATAALALAGTGCLHPNPDGGVAAEAAGRPVLTGGAMPSSPVQQELSEKPAAALMFSMAEGLEKGGKDVEAIAYYEKARALDAKLGDRAARRLAVLYDKADDQARAMHEFQECLKKRPKDPALLNDVGYSLYNRGQWVEAEAYLRKAVAADKGFRPAWVNLGLALAQQGKHPEAIEAFSHGVSPAEAYANLGFVLAVQGRRDEAYAAYRRSLALEPALKISQAALARLERGDLPRAKPAAGAPAADGSSAAGPDSTAPAGASGFAAPNDPIAPTGFATPNEPDVQPERDLP